MADVEIKKVLDIALVNPFVAGVKHIQAPALDNVFAARVVSMEVDKETFITKPVFEQYDQQAEIQACKNLCGMEYMKKLLASGQVSAEDLADNAGQEYDLTIIPETPQEALRKANQVNETIGKLAAQIGCEEGKKYTGQEVESMLTAFIKKQYEAQQAQAAAGGAQQ